MGREEKAGSAGSSLFFDLSGRKRKVRRIPWEVKQMRVDG
jgi:hypothetical protein